MENEFNLESIVGFEALLESAHKCKANVLWKDSVIAYINDDIRQTLKLSRQLHEGTYVPKPAQKFMVTSPKPREIISIAFRDRVYQRSLNDNYLYPTLTRSFINTNLACQKGKGTDVARWTLKEYLQRFYRKYGTEGFVLKCDIKGYYPNMRHDITEDMFRKKIDPLALELVKDILDGQYKGEVGFNPGSQLIQLVGITMLDGLDHYIKERLGIKWYLRYMDDFILIHPDKEYLEKCRNVIDQRLAELGLWLHPDKTIIQKASDPIDFLGFKYRLTDTGKVVITLLPEKVSRERRKIRRMAHRVANGLMEVEKMDECYYSWRAHVSGKRKNKGDMKRIRPNTHKLLARMDSYYYSLRREALNGLQKKKNGHQD